MMGRGVKKLGTPRGVEVNEKKFSQATTHQSTTTSTTTHQSITTSKRSLTHPAPPQQAITAMSTLTLPATVPPFVAPFLPTPLPNRPYLTLTYATSLDSQLSLSPGIQTALSGPASKALTHHLRTHHSAILIGASTAIADDPGLNSRLPGTPHSAQPRPIILDPRFRYQLTRSARVLQAARSGAGKAPYIFVGRSAVGGGDDPRVFWVEEAGGQVVVLEDPVAGEGWAWEYLVGVLAGLGVGSVMVEGGGRVINDLLRAENRRFVDAVVVTVAPVYLGEGGVQVCPERAERGEAAVRLADVQWLGLGRDVVMAARVEG